jgi:hypothetical protein
MRRPPAVNGNLIIDGEDIPKQNRVVRDHKGNLTVTEIVDGDFVTTTIPFHGDSLCIDLTYLGDFYDD